LATLPPCTCDVLDPVVERDHIHCDDATQAASGEAKAYYAREAERRQTEVAEVPAFDYSDYGWNAVTESLGAAEELRQATKQPSD
jgi:hypothetical protein